MLNHLPLGLSLCLSIVSVFSVFGGCATSGGSATESATPAAASGGLPPPATVEEQIALGGTAYGQFCAGCHGSAGQGTDKAPAVVGADALSLNAPDGRKRKAQFRTAMDVAQFVVAKMPPAPRAKPSETEYWAILAFALNANGATPKQLVGPDNAASIVIHP